MNPRIIVSAVCVYDAAGRLLTVRKRGTDRFMHPGGKPEPGESALQAAARELQEEVGIVVDPRELELMGVWLAQAANEAATEIEATVFTAPGAWEAHPSAEIAEIRWLDLSAELPHDLA
ncbi:MAG: hydrolase, partial [Arthrobacter sp.]|nr:hydrolase [Arthrobacter sp.]